DVDLDDLVILRGLVTAIKDGEVTIEEALAVKTNEPEKKVKPSKLNNAVPTATATTNDQPQLDPIEQLRELAKSLGCPADGIDGVVAVAENESVPSEYIRSKPWETKAKSKQKELA